MVGHDDALGAMADGQLGCTPQTEEVTTRGTARGRCFPQGREHKEGPIVGLTAVQLLWRGCYSGGRIYNKQGLLFLIARRHGWGMLVASIHLQMSVPLLTERTGTDWISI
jgi:hypothetical protein